MFVPKGLGRGLGQSLGQGLSQGLARALAKPLGRALAKALATALARASAKALGSSTCIGAQCTGIERMAVAESCTQGAAENVILIVGFRYPWQVTQVPNDLYSKAIFKHGRHTSNRLEKTHSIPLALASSALGRSLQACHAYLKGASGYDKQPVHCYLTSLAPAYNKF